MNMLYCVWTVLVYLICKASSQCTFPSSLQGQWLRSRDTKTLSFTSPTTVTGFNLESKKQTVDEFTCYITEGSKYVLRSERYNNILPDTYIYIYICYDMVAVGSKAFYIYEITERTSEINNNERGAVYSDTIPVTLSDICTLTRNDVQYTTLVSIAGLATNSITYCPDILLGAFNYTQEALVSQCAGTSTLTACNNRVSISANQTSCSGDYFGYSVGGFLLCTATLQFSTVTYVTLYNKDSSVDGSTSHRFSCLAIERSGEGLLMTQFPTDCELGQSGTSVSSPGFKFTLQPQVLCPIPDPTTTSSSPPNVTDDDDDNIPIIVGALVGVIFLLALILLIILCIRSKKRKKTKVADSTENPFPKEKQQNGLHLQDRNKANSPTSATGVVILSNNNKGESNLHMGETMNSRRSSGDVVIGTKRTEKPSEIVPRLDHSDDKPRTNIAQPTSQQSKATTKNRSYNSNDVSSSKKNLTSRSQDYENSTDSNSMPQTTASDIESRNREKDGFVGNTAGNSNPDAKKGPGEPTKNSKSDVKKDQTNGNNMKGNGEYNKDFKVDDHDSGEAVPTSSVTTLHSTKPWSTKNTTGLLQNGNNSPNTGSSKYNVSQNTTVISGKGTGVKSDHARDDETGILTTNDTTLRNSKQASVNNAEGGQNSLDNSINKGAIGPDSKVNTPITLDDKTMVVGVGYDSIQSHASGVGGAILASNTALLQNTAQSPTKISKQSILNDSSYNEHSGSGLHRSVSGDKTLGDDLKNGRGSDHSSVDDGIIKAASGATVSKDNMQTSVAKNKGAQKKFEDSSKKASKKSSFPQNTSGISINQSSSGAVNNNFIGDQACVNSGISSASGIPKHTGKHSTKNIQSKQNNSKDYSFKGNNETNVSPKQENDYNNGESIDNQKLDNQLGSMKNGAITNSGILADQMSGNVNSSKTKPSTSQFNDGTKVKSSAHAPEAVTPNASSSMRKSSMSDTSTSKDPNCSELTKSPDTVNTFHESGYSTPISYESEGASGIDETQTSKGSSKRGAFKRRIKHKTDTVNYSGVYQEGASNIIEGLSGKFLMDKIKAGKKEKRRRRRRRHGVTSKSKDGNKSEITSDSDEFYSETSSDFDVTETDLFDPGTVHADGLSISGQEIINRKESVISSVGPASCALISPKDSPTKKTSIISQILDDETYTTKSKKGDKKDKPDSKKKKKK